MFHFTSEDIVRMLAAFPVIFFAITVHEFSHAWIAVRCGDPTPERQGRLTLNPMAHLHPVGTLMIIITVLAGFGFGWGRPVMINPMNFRNPRWDELKVALAGPASNMIQATAIALIMPFLLLAAILTGQSNDEMLFRFLGYLFLYGITINLALAFFNLIPLFPLDGEKVLLQSLPLRQARKLAQIRPYGWPILIGLIMFGQLTNGRFDIILLWIRGLSMPFFWFLTTISQAILQALLQWFT